MMDPRYRFWIAGKLADSNPLSKCFGWTLEMQQVFPELMRVGGYVTLSTGSEYTHWWLVDPDGKVVDPSVAQYEGPEFNTAVVGYRGMCQSIPNSMELCQTCSWIGLHCLTPHCAEMNERARRNGSLRCRVEFCRKGCPPLLEGIEVVRASGEVCCELCGQPLYKHPTFAYWSGMNHCNRGCDGKFYHL